MFEVGVPFFLPVWRRYAVVVVAFCWSLFEFSQGAVFWGILFVGMAGWAAWKFWTTDWAAVEAAAEQDHS